MSTDSVSISALALNLVPGLSPLLSAPFATGEPTRITRRMLDVSTLVGPMEAVYVCENPTVVSVAADALGPRSAPLICTEGWPSTVTTALLDRLIGAGAELRVHADFDADGVSIAGFVMARGPAAPWRFNTDDYLAALAGPTLDLPGAVAPARWDTDLGPAMNSAQRAVHEEALVDTLLDDLGHQ